MMFVGDYPERTGTRAAVEQAHRLEEGDALVRALAQADPGEAARGRIRERAVRLVEGVRAAGTRQGGIEAFLQEYELSNREGIVLMCLAEALLRIPDAATADRLIRDKLGDADWERHVGQSESVFVNASTLALMLTGRVIRMRGARRSRAEMSEAMRTLVARAGEPVIRQALVQAMRILGRQFVMGRTIGEALARARDDGAGERHSFDMLGEAARTQADADRYFEAYAQAIQTVGEAAAGSADADARPGISVKLSALHPRYELAKRGRVLRELVPRLASLAGLARNAGIGLCVDAEEADRLDLSLDAIEAVFRDPALGNWAGFGLAVQAYQKRALPLIDWLGELASSAKRRLNVRLVKGAYWDTEIKRAQEAGLDGYPVYTRKMATDVSYLACARKLFALGEGVYPQFATHNAHTAAAVIEMAGGRRTFEFQRLHGMGEALYAHAVKAEAPGIACRVYAPVGGHEELLAYLVRRLLENGANTSFVNRISDLALPVAEIVADPVEATRRLKRAGHPRIPLPTDLLRPERANSRGIDFGDPSALRALRATMAAAAGPWTAAPVVGGAERPGKPRSAFDPADRGRLVGSVAEADRATIEDALARASAAAPAWDEVAAEERAAALERTADLFEAHRAELMALCVREAGKTLDDALAEVREAADFCRYYAARARAEFGAPLAMPGPTGERNTLALRGRGAFVCISPWNFPLAIFAGQTAAALAAGNAVLAKPAEQTPLIAARAVQLMHRAGIPTDALHLLPGDGPGVGAPLVGDERIGGVAFTGSVEVAQSINRTLGQRRGPIVPLIAETGGQNAMIVDSTALPEQIVADAVVSAFRSAGQRCSALRVLFLQREVASKIRAMLAGAIAELRVGDPGLLRTDVGPVIDAEAKANLEAHIAGLEREGGLIARAALSKECAQGTFVAPVAFAIDRLERLEREVFGPVLHVVEYAADRLDQVIEAINRTGYGLTLGIHTRVDATARAVAARVRAGNAYVNRNMIGAVVGVQPFGGQGLSGTGPKAGGPRYLHRFAVERTLSVNTTAAGGNAALLALDDRED